MKKILLILLLFTIKSYGQAPVLTQISTQINGHRTINHINIPGTGIFLIPPSHFTISASLPGFIKNDSTLIVAYELLDRSQIAALPPMGQPQNQQSGLNIIEYKKITVNGCEGAYIVFRKDNMNAYGLVFGNSTYRVMITGTALANDVSLRNEIIYAYNNIVYENH